MTLRSMPRARAALFDMDGTLVDNMRFHAEAWLEMAAALGVHGLTVEVFEQTYAGQKNEEIFPQLLGRALPVDELRVLAARKEERYRALAAPSLAPMPGLLSFLARLRGAGVKIAVATLAPKENRALVLEQCGLAGYVDVVIGAEDVVRGKPAPDIFEKAAAAVGVDVDDCVAFEDAKNGVLSARAAGIDTIGVVTATAADVLVAAGAALTITHYDPLPPALAARFFGA